MAIKIIIAGAGFGGVRAALDLNKLLPDADVTLINSNALHTYIPDLYEVASANITSTHLVEQQHLRGTVAIPLDLIFRNTKVRVVIDQILGIDLNQKVLQTSQQNLNYDYLILSLGSTTNYFGITGAQEYSHPLKSVGDALKIRNDLHQIVLSSKKPRIVIAGGGFTGVELAGELQEMLKFGCSLTIVEAGPSILMGMPDWAQQDSLKRLQKLQVNILTKHQIKEVSANSLLCDTGEEIEFDYLIWTTGVQGQPLSNNILGVERTKKNQISVDQNLSIPTHPEVFVVGDLAEFLDPQTQKPMAITARTAIDQAKFAARNLVSKVKNQTMKSYQVPAPWFVVPVGGKMALSTVFGVKLTGFLAWVLKELVALKYFLSILPFFTALNLWWQGVEVFMSNDTI
jgi:NADH:ubiquinone reductase (H+-translocating)